MFLGIWLLGYDMYIMNNCEKINSKISIHRTAKNRKYATVGYEFNNKKYTEITILMKRRV